ncbi:hypothetical protein NDU88_002088 [Pleurodeles waltl]|uniref:Uncharacterized protein n=1 Tax=Pleurodeles waltl TaxID=8319 RepID=A0AAV7SAV4_PLEWA|nr:hypothetical protein NDU88_002088 [Pleurodeles waltl]
MSTYFGSLSFDHQSLSGPRARFPRPWGTSGAFCSDPEVIFPAPRNAEWPDSDEIFKSPDLTPETKELDPRNEKTTDGPPATLTEETTMPGPSHGGDEQEAAGC